MAKSRRKRSSNPLAVGITVDVDFGEVNRYLDYLSSAAKTALLKKGVTEMASKTKPRLKKDIKEEVAEGGQSTGALARSVIRSKVWGKSKKVDQSAGVAVGPQYRYQEKITDRPNLKPTDRKRFISTPTEINYSGKGRRRKKTVKHLRQVLVNTKRLRKRRGADHQLAIPAMYWHLVEFGFTHRSGTKAIAYLIRPRARDTYIKKAQEEGKQKILKGLTPQLMKRLKRRKR